MIDYNTNDDGVCIKQWINMYRNVTRELTETHSKHPVYEYNGEQCLLFAKKKPTRYQVS